MKVPKSEKLKLNSQMILAGQAVAIARVNDMQNAFFCRRLTDLILQLITTSFNLTAPILG